MAKKSPVARSRQIRNYDPMGSSREVETYIDRSRGITLTHDTFSVGESVHYEKRIVSFPQLPFSLEFYQTTGTICISAYADKGYLIRASRAVFSDDTVRKAENMKKAGIWIVYPTSNDESDSQAVVSVRYGLEPLYLTDNPSLEMLASDILSALRTEKKVERGWVVPLGGLITVIDGKTREEQSFVLDCIYQGKPRHWTIKYAVTKVEF